MASVLLAVAAFSSQTRPVGATSVITVARVDTGGSGGANVRRSPSTSAAVVRTIPHGSWAELTCSVEGQTVWGQWGATDLWYLTTSGGFVSDAVLYTGTSQAVVAACAAGQGGYGGTSAIPVATASTGGNPLNVRAGPSVNTSILRTQGDGSYVELGCALTGQAITGQWGTTTLWYRLVGGGYVSDAVIFTGTNDPVTPPCSVPATSTGSAVFVATGGAPLNRRTGPATWESVLSTIPDGTFLDLDCAVFGQTIWGGFGATDLWYRLVGGGYVTDGLIFTGSNDPVRPMCVQGAGTPASDGARGLIRWAAEAELASGEAYETGSWPFVYTSPRVNQYLALTGLGPAKPWCAAFVSWVVNYPVGDSPLTRFRSAAVGEWVRAARRQQFNLRIVPAAAIMPGDLVAIDGDGGGDFFGNSHMGVVVAPLSSEGVTSIDGNTYAQGNPSSGLAVYRRTRALDTSGEGEMTFIRIGG